MVLLAKILGTAVAPQLWASSQNAFGVLLMVISKKIGNGTSRGVMAFTTKYPNFVFFLHYLLVPLVDTISAELSLNSPSTGVSCLCRGLGILKFAFIHYTA